MATTFAFPTTKSQRTCRNLMRMVAELHARGYQRLRICPEWYPHGDEENWTCNIRPRRDVSRLHGARGNGKLVALYESPMNRQYFGWPDVEHSTPSQLADLFIERFPELATAGLGMDVNYVAWYQLMMSLTFPGFLPVADDPVVDTDEWLHVSSSTQERAPILVPRPPGGDLKVDRVSDFSSFVGSRETPQRLPITPATQESFGRPQPMPDLQSPIRYLRWLSAVQFSALSLGSVPKDMEDKWFAYVKDDTFHLHRSWTGFCIWTVRFERLPEMLGGGYLASETIVNRELKQISQSVDEELRMLDLLTMNLARINLGLPVYSESAMAPTP